MTNPINSLRNFDWRRAMLLLRKDLAETRRIGGIALLAIAGFLLLSSHFSELVGRFSIETGTEGLDPIGWLNAIGWPLLLIATSLAFTELGDKTRNEEFLLLPASLAEKFIVRLVTVSLIFPLVFFVFFTVLTLIITFSLWLVYSAPFSGSFANASQGEYFWGEYFWAISSQWRHLWLIQPVFFVGAIWFRKWHFLRTILVLLLLVIAMSAFLAVCGYLLFGGLLAENWEYRRSFSWPPYYEYWSNYVPLRYLWGLLQVLFAVLLWYLAWLRFIEVQSSDGI